MPVRKTVTLEWLVGEGACAHALLLFQGRWVGAPTIHTVLKALWQNESLSQPSRSEWSEWLLERLLPEPLLGEWSEVMADEGEGDAWQAFMDTDLKYARKLMELP